MFLEEKNYKKIINSFSTLEWKPLIELIPRIENTEKFEEAVGGGIEDKVIQIPYWVQGEIVSEFFEIVYAMPIIIDFDWGSWDEGRIIARDEYFDFDTIDIPTKCKLITAFVRNDRYCDGALICAFESGLILRILKSIEKQIAETGNKNTQQTIRKIKK